MTNIPIHPKQSNLKSDTDKKQTTSAQSLPPIISLIRPAQWVKNIFVFMPLFFGGELFAMDSFICSLVAAVAFCLMASSIYCFNDIHDAESDRRHPLKRLRPVASGRISEQKAYIVMGCLSVASLAITMLLPPMRRMATTTILLFYFLLNIAYCLWLKHFAIIDVCIVAFGFVLRVLMGSEATHIEPSHWIVLVTFLLCLFLSLCKRRDDVERMNRTGEALRRNTSRYNLTFIDQAITLTATGCFVCYVMYTVSPEVCEQFHSRYLYLTGIFPIVGLLRYIQIAVVDSRAGDPTQTLLSDRLCQVIVLLWLVSFLLIIYL